MQFFYLLRIYLVKKNPTIGLFEADLFSGLIFTGHGSLNYFVRGIFNEMMFATLVCCLVEIGKIIRMYSRRNRSGVFKKVCV